MTLDTGGELPHIHPVQEVTIRRIHVTVTGDGFSQALALGRQWRSALATARALAYDGFTIRPQPSPLPSVFRPQPTGPTDTATAIMRAAQWHAHARRPPPMRPYWPALMYAAVAPNWSIATAPDLLQIMGINPVYLLDVDGDIDPDTPVPIHRPVYVCGTDYGWPWRLHFFVPDPPLAPESTPWPEGLL